MAEASASYPLPSQDFVNFVVLRTEKKVEVQAYHRMARLVDPLFNNIGVRLISDIYRQFFLFGFTQWFRSFCADRKNQRTLRMGAFLTAAEADDFWGCGTRSLRSLKQSSPLSKSHWRRLPKSLMRINEPVNEEMRGLVQT